MVLPIIAAAVLVILYGSAGHSSISIFFSTGFHIEQIYIVKTLYDIVSPVRIPHHIQCLPRHHMLQEMATLYPWQRFSPFHSTHRYGYNIFFSSIIYRSVWEVTSALNNYYAIMISCKGRSKA